MILIETIIGNKNEIIQKLLYLENDIKYQIDIKKYKEKRSLSQNAYAWKLITELGNKLRKSKEEVYLQMLRDYGQSEVVSILSSISPSGYFKYYDEIGSGIVNKKEFTHYKIYKGSSEFDINEMSIFLEGIRQECEQVGINVLTRQEIALMDLK